MIHFLLIYYSAISIISAAVTALDKLSAKRGLWRIPENTLLLLGLSGGAVAEYITMKIIRHKTRHKKFMIILPVEAVIHITVISILICTQ